MNDEESRIIYTEDDTEYLVEVLEDSSDNEMIKLKLKVLNVIRPSRMYKNPEPGHIFECSSVRKYFGSYLCWNIYGYEPKSVE